jgi:antibiotic biosynthesis monooxygenase (ABM) superfamily enzyme
MARKMHELLRKLQEDTANEISELQQSEGIGTWFDEQSEPTAVYHAKDLATALYFLEEELSVHGFSLKTH